MVAARLTLEHPGSVIPLSKHCSVESMFILSVTVSVFGTDIKFLMAHAQCLSAYQLLFTLAPTVNNLVISIIQSGQWTQVKFMLTCVVQERDYQFPHINGLAARLEPGDNSITIEKKFSVS
jgi:hypothetical protein